MPLETDLQQAKYIRIYSDENGDSHFEDLEIPLTPVDFASPAAPLNIAQFLPATQTVWVGAPVGWAGDAPIQVQEDRFFVPCRASTK